MYAGDIGTVVCEEADFEIKEEYEDAWGDISGAMLDPAKVMRSESRRDKDHS